MYEDDELNFDRLADFNDDLYYDDDDFLDEDIVEMLQSTLPENNDGLNQDEFDEDENDETEDGEEQNYDEL